MDKYYLLLVLNILMFCSPILAQERSLLNKDKKELKPGEEAEFIQYCWTEDWQILNNVYSLDSTLITSCVIDFDGKKKNNRIIEEYYSDGTLKRKIEENLISKSSDYSYYYPSGKLRTNIHTSKFNASKSISYDEAGKPLSIPLDELPQPKKGIKELSQYFTKNLTYPITAKSNGEEGIVYLNFTVNESGHLKDLRLGNPGEVSKALEDEALFVMGNYIQQAKPWLPGKENGQASSLDFNFPIAFFIPPWEKVAEESKQKP